MMKFPSKLNKKFLTKFQYRLNFAWILLLLPFIINSYRQVSSSKYVGNTTESGINFLDPSYLVNLFGFDSSNIGKFGLTIFIKFLFLALPIISLTTFEYLNSDSPRNKFSDTSIAKIKDSKGYKNADFWYYFLYLISSNFQFILVFLSLGLININHSIDTFFQNIYQPIVQIPHKGIIPSLIMIIAVLNVPIVGPAYGAKLVGSLLFKFKDFMQKTSKTRITRV